MISGISRSSEYNQTIHYSRFRVQGLNRPGLKIDTFIMFSSQVV